MMMLFIASGHFLTLHFIIWNILHDDAVYCEWSLSHITFNYFGIYCMMMLFIVSGHFLTLHLIIVEYTA